ncbi:9045_t:CDS:2 [Funneliformis geosporum]|nr:9045_t:CDS:2 [Funneliformis geosporum]
MNGMQHLILIEINKSGDCISNEYINGSSHLRWKCAKGYKWNATLESKRNGNCLSNSYKDAHSGIALKDIYGMPHLLEAHENCWLDFLKTSKYSQGLQLDILYPEYGFAIEQARDQLKKELCEENQIALRYVWYYENPYVIIPEHLRELGLIE